MHSTVFKLGFLGKKFNGITEEDYEDNSFIGPIADYVQTMSLDELLDGYSRMEPEGVFTFLGDGDASIAEAEKNVDWTDYDDVYEDVAKEDTQELGGVKKLHPRVQYVKVSIPGIKAVLEKNYQKIKDIVNSGDIAQVFSPAMHDLVSGEVFGDYYDIEGFGYMTTVAFYRVCLVWAHADGKDEIIFRLEGALDYKW